MPRFKPFLLMLLPILWLFAPPAAGATDRAGIGSPITPGELRGFFAIPPDGRGLPAGRGTASRGQRIYAEQCASCHGERLEGSPEGGGGPLIGGRGSLAGPAPKRTVESYWPYATTLFDYIKRTMPFAEPGSLSDESVYSLVAYILAEGGIIARDLVIDARSLPKVRMPNRDGFRPQAEAPVRGK